MSNVCEKCEKPIVEPYGSGRFCNSKCARSFATLNCRKEISEKVSSSLRGRESNQRPEGWAGITSQEYQCPMCDENFVVTYNSRHRKFCSKSCFHSFVFSDKNPNKDVMMEVARNAGKKSAMNQSQNRRSKNEILFSNMCKSRFDDCLNNHEIVDGWDADVVIPSKKVAVMWNGQWHYYPIVGDEYLKKVKKRDNIKLNSFMKSGYNVYVIEDHGKHNPDFVKEKFEKFTVWIDSLP